MKKLLMILVIMVVAIGCRKTVDDTRPPTFVQTDFPFKQQMEKDHGKKLIIDSFGLKQFNNIKRPYVQGKKPTTHPGNGGGNGGGNGNGNGNGGGDTTVTPPPPPPPSSDYVILLDFDGHDVTGTSWNYIPVLNCTPANMTTEEQTRILDSVRHDYAPFRVTVTVDEQVFAAAERGMRIIFTEYSEWFGNGAGGTAFLNTWLDKNTPVFVFTKMLAYNVKFCFEAASHEAGHAFDLKHQATFDANCVQTSPYNYGTAELAPIMGVAYYARRGEWWIGPSWDGCNAIQDDKAILASKVGLR
jgi:hypothetical protein